MQKKRKDRIYDLRRFPVNANVRFFAIFSGIFFFLSSETEVVANFKILLSMLKWASIARVHANSRPALIFDISGPKQSMAPEF